MAVYSNGTLIGYADVKETLKEMVCLPLKKPEMISHHGLGLPAGVFAGLAALIVSAPLVSEQMTALSHEAVATTARLLE